MENALGSLLADRERSKRDSERVRSAAIVASDIRFDADVHLQALLDRAAASIRPDIAFWGLFGTIEGPVAVVRARSYNGDPLIEGVEIGSRVPLAETLLPEIIASGGAVGFDDLRATGLLESRRLTKGSGARAAVGIVFRAGAQLCFLRFTADQPMSEPFDDVDRAYIELVALLFAQRVRSRDQLERLRFAIGHDLLTELPNRATLRASIIASLASQGSGALIVLDLDRFRDLRLMLGSQTADAVIVEVAIALRALALPGERLGRIGSDVFALYVPGLDRQAALDRARQIVARFAQPFGTGDRERIQRVSVTASVGVSVLPDDAVTVDELFARAEAAVDLAKRAGRNRVIPYFRGCTLPVPRLL